MIVNIMMATVTVIMAMVALIFILAGVTLIYRLFWRPCGLCPVCKTNPPKYYATELVACNFSFGDSRCCSSECHKLWETYSYKAIAKRAKKHAAAMAHKAKQELAEKNRKAYAKKHSGEVL